MHGCYFVTAFLLDNLIPDENLERYKIKNWKKRKNWGTFFDYLVSNIKRIVYFMKEYRKELQMMNGTEFCKCVNQYRNQLYMIAHAVLRNETDAEDAVCNAVLKGYEHREQLKNSRKFKAWMLTITKNEALKVYKKRMELPGDEEVERLLPPTQDSHHELWDIIQELKEEYRLVIVLFYYNDLSIRNISDVLSVPVGTVKSRLNRGRELLRKALEEEKGEN